MKIWKDVKEPALKQLGEVQVASFGRILQNNRMKLSCTYVQSASGRRRQPREV